MSTFIFQIILITLAIGLYIPTQLWCFKKLKWGTYPTSFWGSKSDLRKYKAYNSSKGPDFPGSIFWLAFLTDGYHLFQFLSWRCIYGAVAISTPYPWWVFGAMFIGMPFFFWLFQELLTKPDA